MSDSMAPVESRPTLTWRGAQVVVEAATAKAQEMGINIVVVVVDKGAQPVAVLRMDGASHLNTLAAEGKARGAASLGRATAEFLEYVQKDEPLYRAILSQGNMFLIGGGEPLKVDGYTVGAVGVSGARHVQDLECALAGAAAFHASLS